MNDVQPMLASPAPTAAERLVELLMRASEMLDSAGKHGEAIALHCHALDLITQEHLHEPASLAMH